MSKHSELKQKRLPAGWSFRDGAYYYQVPPGCEATWNGQREVLLGRSLLDAQREWAKTVNPRLVVNTVADLLDRYTLEVVPYKAVTTQESNAFAMVRLKEVLGETPILEVTPRVIHQYFDQREHKVAARREIEVISHAYSKAVEWGLIDRHPFKWEVKLPREVSRKRNLEDWEVAELLALKPMRKVGGVLAIQAYIRLQLMTGLRRADLLKLKVSSLNAQGIDIADPKTGKHVMYQWTDELRAAVTLAINSRPAEQSPWVFCKADGTGYLNESTGHADGWDSMWGRFVDRVLDETKVIERFTEHDLRAKCVRDNPTVELAKTLLARLRPSEARVFERASA